MDGFYCAIYLWNRVFSIANGNKPQHDDDLEQKLLMIFYVNALSVLVT